MADDSNGQTGTRQYSQEVRDLHNTMVKELSEEIAPCPSLMDKWHDLLYLFSNKTPLSTVTIDKIKNVGDLVKELMTAGYICFEDYEPFARKLEQVHQQMAKRVRQYALKISEQIKTDKESIR
ncbi:uncharacterized protein [Argopecten irradians]